MANIKVKIRADTTPAISVYASFYTSSLLQLSTKVENYETARQYFGNGERPVKIMFFLNNKDIQQASISNGNCLAININTAAYKGNLAKIRLTPQINSYYNPNGAQFPTSADMLWDNASIDKTPSRGIAFDITGGVCASSPSNKSEIFTIDVPQNITDGLELTGFCIRPYAKIDSTSSSLELSIQVELLDNQGKALVSPSAIRRSYSSFYYEDGFSYIENRISINSATSPVFSASNYPPLQGQNFDRLRYDGTIDDSDCSLSLAGKVINVGDIILLSSITPQKGNINVGISGSAALRFSVMQPNSQLAHQVIFYLTPYQ